MRFFLCATVGAVAALTLSSSSKKSTPIDKLAKEVRKESSQQFELHEIYRNLETKDEDNEKKIKADRNLVMLQTSPLKTVEREVDWDSHENIHISDSFTAEEKKDIAVEKAIKANKNLHALIQTSPVDLEKQVQQESHSRVRISDQFVDQEKEDEKQEKKVKADKNLRAMMIQKKPFDIDSMGTAADRTKNLVSNSDDDSSESSALSSMDKYMNEFSNSRTDGVLKSDDFSQHIAHTRNDDGAVISIPLSSQLQVSTSLLQTATKTKTAPGVDAEVQRERKWDVYLGDTYAKLEKGDKKHEREIKADSNLKA